MALTITPRGHLHERFLFSRNIFFILLFRRNDVFHGFQYISLSLMTPCLSHLHEIFDTAYFATFHYGLSSWISFAILSIIPIGISFVETMFLFNEVSPNACWDLQELYLIYWQICISWLQLVWKLLDLSIFFPQYWVVPKYFPIHELGKIYH